MTREAAALEAVTRILARSEVFGRLPLDRLEHLAAVCRVRRYAKGDQVFARGDTSEALFILAVGSVSLSVSSADGAEVTLAVLAPPTVFGELSIIDDGNRSATATARQSTVVVAVPKQVFRSLLADHPSVALALLRTQSALLRHIDDRATDLVLVDLRGRVAKFLAAAAGAPVPAGRSVGVELRLSQTELARLVGGSRQQVNRLIMRLEADGAIQRSGSRIVSVRPDLLVLPG